MFTLSEEWNSIEAFTIDVTDISDSQRSTRSLYVDTSTIQILLVQP